MPLPIVKGRRVRTAGVLLRPAAVPAKVERSMEYLPRPKVETVVLPNMFTGFLPGCAVWGIIPSSTLMGWPPATIDASPKPTKS